MQVQILGIKSGSVIIATLVTLKQSALAALQAAIAGQFKMLQDFTPFDIGPEGPSSPFQNIPSLSDLKSKCLSASQGTNTRLSICWKQLGLDEPCCWQEKCPLLLEQIL